MTREPSTSNDFLNRTIPLISAEGVERLTSRRIAIAGCGGVGGALALTLCRTGVGSFRLADPADFDPPDMNRQWGALGRTMGRNKAEVYRDMILDINPNAKVEVFRNGVTNDNQPEFLQGADVLVDCLDAAVPYELRENMHARARQMGIFSVVGPILGFGCFALCSSPTGMSMEFWTNTLKNAKEKKALPPIFKEFFVPEQISVIGSSLQIGKIPTLAIGVLIASSLLATECVAHLLGGVLPGSRKPIVLPQAMFFDLLKMTYRIVNVSEMRARFEGGE
ncbi:MAG: ThiF family adenylyltransferase [Myxococcota bacterium]